MVSCARPIRLTVALDEAFVAARPDLASRLERLRPPGVATKFVGISLNESPAKAVEAGTGLPQGHEPDVLIASPLVAAGLQGRQGAVPLIALEWQAAPAPGLTAIATDPLPAYREAGRAAGAYVAAARASRGGNPACGILYSSSPARPHAALEAFAAAYEASSGAAPLLVRSLQPAPSGAPNATDAQAAVAELLGSDLRVLFIAAGSVTAEAVKAVTVADIAIGADLREPLPLSALSFMIVADDAALVRAAGGALAAWERSRAAPGDRSSDAARGGSWSGQPLSVPALVLPGPAASRASAGQRPFSSYLRED